MSISTFSFRSKRLCYRSVLNISIPSAIYSRTIENLSIPGHFEAAGKTNGSAPNGQPRSFEATVVRVWSADQLSLLPKDSKTERRVQLSSTRGPKCVFTFNYVLSY